MKQLIREQKQQANILKLHMQTPKQTILHNTKCLLSVNSRNGKASQQENM